MFESHFSRKKFQREHGKDLKMVRSQYVANSKQSVKSLQNSDFFDSNYCSRKRKCGAEVEDGAVIFSLCLNRLWHRINCFQYTEAIGLYRNENKFNCSLGIIRFSWIEFDFKQFINKYFKFNFASNIYLVNWLAEMWIFKFIVNLLAWYM